MHRRRDSIRRYLRQQYGYGKAEALLERKWPTHYNRAGSSRWSGRIYEAPAAQTSRRPLVRYGTWGTALFQSVYEPPRFWTGMLQAPEGLLLVALLGEISALGLLWPPLLVAAPVFFALVAWIFAGAIANGWRSHHPRPGESGRETLRRRAVTSLLFLLQPLARLAGRLRNGLSPWRRRARPLPALPRPRTVEVWSESWRDPKAWVEQLQDGLTVAGGFVHSGGPFDRWDLDLRAGPLGGVKIRTVVEEHGSGKQLLRVRIWPRASAKGAAAVLLLAALAAWALASGEMVAGITFAAALVVLVGFGVEGCATAMSLALSELEPEAEMMASGVEAPAPAPAATEPVVEPTPHAAALLEEVRR